MACLAQRRYQTLNELRSILVYVYNKGHEALSDAQKADLRITTMPAYSLVQVTDQAHSPFGHSCWQMALDESTQDKRAEDRAARNRDEAELVEKGKFLPLEQQVELQKKVAAFFRAPDPDPVTAPDAMRFQSHVLLHLLSDAVIPVSTSIARWSIVGGAHRSCAPRS